MKCNDKLLTYLNKFNYNVLKIPKTNFEPGICLSKEDGVFAEFGSFQKIFGVGLPEPIVRKMADFGTRITNKLKSDVGIKLLDGILSSLTGGSSIETTSVYSKAASIEFEFEDPTELVIDKVTIADVLKRARIDESNSAIKKLLIDREGELFVVNQVLKSNRILVNAYNKVDAKMELSVPEIKNLVKGKLTVDSSKETKNGVEYIKDGPELTFGFMIFMLSYNDGQISITSTKASGAHALSIGADGAHPEVLENILIDY